MFSISIHSNAVLRRISRLQEKTKIGIIMENQYTEYYSNRKPTTLGKSYK